MPFFPTKFRALFEPGKIGTMTLKNRLVMPPMVRNYATANGLVTPRYVDHIESIAKGGVGMIILEASFIRPDGKGFVNELGIHHETTVGGLRKLASVAHRHGAKIGIQLYHAGRQTSAKITGVQPVAPSPIPDPSSGEMPRELEKKEIKELVATYAKAAARAKRANLDFVEIHGAHGYLITQFLSPFSNRRTDAYGGSFEKRLTFVTEVYKAVRRKVGKKFPVTMRLSADEMVKGGLTVKDTVKIAKHLEKLGLDALHISAGNYASYAKGFMIPPMAQPDGTMAYLAEAIKRAVKIPVIAVGKLRSPVMDESLLKQKKADFIAIGRTLLADPEWPKKVQEGRLDDINRCVACNQGCISRLFAQQDVWCTVNPACGREALFAAEPGLKKHVLVVGGGPGGLEAAIVAAKRGHRVTLYEKRKELGGQLKTAGVLPYRHEWEWLRQHLIRELKQLNGTVILKKEFHPDLIGEERFDVAILAIGASPVHPRIPGIDREQVVTARDVLDGKRTVRGAVVVAGGGCQGSQVAEYLAVKKHHVTVVEMTDAVATDAPVDDRALLLERLEKLDVTVMTKTKILNIGPKTVTVDTGKGIRSLPADTVVTCLGFFPNNGLQHELQQYVKKVVTIGDCREVRRITDAIMEGALAALEA